MKLRSNSMAAAAATLLLATTCVVAQDGHDQRQARQEQRREQRQENRDQRGFQPPAGKSRGFGAQPTGNVQPSASPQQGEAQRNPGNSRLLGPGPHAGDWL